MMSDDLSFASFEILFYAKNHKYSLGRPEPFDALQTRRRLLNEMSVISFLFIYGKTKTG